MNKTFGLSAPNALNDTARAIETASVPSFINVSSCFLAERLRERTHPAGPAALLLFQAQSPRDYAFPQDPSRDRKVLLALDAPGKSSHRMAFRCPHPPPVERH